MRTIIVAAIAASILVTTAAGADEHNPVSGPTPDGGWLNRSGGPGDYRYTYTPPDYPNTQAPYNGAYRSNPYDQGNGAPQRDYEQERQRYQAEPRDAYGMPEGGYRW